MVTEEFVDDLQPLGDECVVGKLSILIDKFVKLDAGVFESLLVVSLLTTADDHFDVEAVQVLFTELVETRVLTFIQRFMVVSSGADMIKK